MMKIMVSNGGGSGSFSCLNIDGEGCVGWVLRYFGDCLCNDRDKISFALGLVGLVFWGVAEIPQIITNFCTKSGHGVSLAFLLTWIIGDVFNLVGCLLEPATLPTQYYTAMLYTATTVVLILQTLYYDYMRRWWRRRRLEVKSKVEDDPKSQRPHKEDAGYSKPIPPSCKTMHHTDIYYTSARSLASSGTPPFRSYLITGRSEPSSMAACDSSSDEEQTTFTKYFKPATPPRRIPHSVGYGTFILGSSSLPFLSEALMQSQGQGEQLLKHGGEGGAYGECLGWMMAAIYMGSRLPQIWLNIKRGSVEGLSPLMFFFALVANVTYVASILVRSTKWKNIHPNLPWLLDAVVCVALDLFILTQFVYYQFIKRKKSSTDYEEHFFEKDKPLLS